MCAVLPAASCRHDLTLMQANEGVDADAAAPAAAAGIDESAAVIGASALASPVAGLSLSSALAGAADETVPAATPAVAAAVEEPEPAPAPPQQPQVAAAPQPPPEIDLLGDDLLGGAWCCYARRCITCPLVCVYVCASAVGAH